ncbi:MAG: hypothetical protein ACR2PZ_24615 [Pseudomonadales bacterium]
MIDPRAESQVNDINGGIYPNGLFWTVEIPRGAFRVTRHGRVAVLSLRNLPLVDTFQFGGPLSAPASVDMQVVWHAVDSPVGRGSGDTVVPTDPAAFLGEFADARSWGKARFTETGFSAKTGKMTADGFFAEMGYERNGVFL